jgi:hypothetical protein
MRSTYGIPANPGGEAILFRKCSILFTQSVSVLKWNWG